MNQKQSLENINTYTLPTYKRLPIVFSKGKGCYLWDMDGKKYLDFLSGIAVNNLGHSHPKVVKALKDQAGKLIHTTNIYGIHYQGLLAKNLCAITGMHQAFICNSGTEAMEAAIKFSRNYQIQIKGPKAIEIISFENSFHGRTFGALAATGQKKFKKNIGPMLGGFKILPLNNIEKLKKVVNNNTCAILFEMIQGEGGVNLIDPNFVREIQSLAKKHKALIILDEIQTGCGRTGNFLASEDYKLKPDIVVLAKGLGNGFPIGACLVSKQIAGSIYPGLHGTTFGGNPLACRVACEVTDIIEKKSFLKNVEINGRYFLESLLNLQKEFGTIANIRGKGLMLGIEFNIDITDNILQASLKRGLLINSIKNRIIRLLPPLIITKAEIDKGIKILRAAIKESLQ